MLLRLPAQLSARASRGGRAVASVVVPRAPAAAFPRRFFARGRGRASPAAALRQTLHSRRSAGHGELQRLLSEVRAQRWAGKPPKTAEQEGDKPPPQTAEQEGDKPPPQTAEQKEKAEEAEALKQLQRLCHVAANLRRLRPTPAQRAIVPEVLGYALEAEARTDGGFRVPASLWAAEIAVRARRREADGVLSMFEEAARRGCGKVSSVLVAAVTGLVSLGRVADARRVLDAYGGRDRRVDRRLRVLLLAAAGDADGLRALIAAPEPEGGAGGRATNLLLAALVEGFTAAARTCSESELSRAEELLDEVWTQVLGGSGSGRGGEKKGKVPSGAAVAALAGAWSMAGRSPVGIVRRYLLAMKERGQRAPRIVTGELMMHFARRGRVERVLEFVGGGAPAPTPLVFNNVLVSLCDAACSGSELAQPQAVARVLELFEKMVDPLLRQAHMHDLFTGVAAVARLVSAYHPDPHEWVDSVLERHPRLTFGLHASGLYVWASLRARGPAETLARLRELAPARLRLNERALNVLLRQCRLEGDVATLRGALAAASDLGVEPGARSYMELLLAYDLMGDMAAADELVFQLLEAGGVVDDVFMEKAVLMHVQRGDVAGADTLLETMHDKLGMQPSVRLFNALLNRARTSRRRVEQLWARMAEWGVQPNSLSHERRSQAYADTEAAELGAAAEEVKEKEGGGGGG